LANVGAAGEHSAVEVVLDADDAQARVGLAEWVRGDLADRGLDRLGRAARRHAVRDCDAQRQLAGLVQLLVTGYVTRRAVAVDDAGKSDRGVVLQQFQQPLDAIALGRLAAKGLRLDKARATA